MESLLENRANVSQIKCVKRLHCNLEKFIIWIFESVDIDSEGNYVYAPGKAVALVGVSDLVVVETEDALLITTRERSQDVGKVVAELKQAGRDDLV